MLDEESSTNKALTECIANLRHALHFTEQYEHATLETNRKELNRTSHLITKPCSLFHRSNGALAYLIHLQSHLNKTKWYILFFYIIHHSKDKVKTFKTPPVYLLHTIGSQKYFGHFAFRQTAAFHYKNVVWIQTPNITDEKLDIQLENRKHF